MKLIFVYTAKDGSEKAVATWHDVEPAVGDGVVLDGKVFKVSTRNWQIRPLEKAELVAQGVMALHSLERVIKLVEWAGYEAKETSSGR